MTIQQGQDYFDYTLKQDNLHLFLLNRPLKAKKELFVVQNLAELFKIGYF